MDSDMDSSPSLGLLIGLAITVPVWALGLVLLVYLR